MPNGRPWGDGHCNGEDSGTNDLARKKSAAIQRKWAALIDQAQPDAQRRVARTVSNWSQRVREQLRNETGFRMSGKDGPVIVRISVDDGMPDGLIAVLSEDLLRLGPLLIHVGHFQRAAIGARLANQHFAEIGTLLKLRADFKPDSDDVLSVAGLMDEIARILATYKIAEGILSFDEDVLGAYFYWRQVVRVYWVPIALLAAVSGLSLEAVTFVVLSHELAHAYTHVGLDINGEPWETRLFADSSDELVEGLAQYYTQRVCEHFEEQFPSGLETFNAIKKHQSLPYTAYEDWPESENGEDMRRLLREKSGRAEPKPVDGKSA